MMPRVALIILCYNGLEDTLACLASLATLEYPTDRRTIIVVDNASTDGTPQEVRRRYPSVEVIESSANLGYAGGNNVGLRYALAADYDYVLLLNNDTEVAPDFLNLLVETAESDPTIGVVGPTIYYHHTPDVIWSAGGTIDWRRGTSAMRGLDQPERDQYTEAQQVDFVSGCALLCKRTVLEQIGLFDERFFMYFEETEWCVRATRAGFRCIHQPAAHIWHKIRPDNQAESPRIAYYMTRNRLLFLQTSGARLSTWLHVALFQEARTITSLSLRAKWRGHRQCRDAMLKGHGDFWRRRFGRQIVAKGRVT